MAGYQELMVWRKSMDLTVETYRLSKKLPKEEKYGLADQMRRASVSMPSNIAEGQDRNSKKEFCNFLYIARGSRAELETQFLICVRVGYLAETEISYALELLKEIGKMLTALISRLKSEN